MWRKSGKRKRRKGERVGGRHQGAVTIVIRIGMAGPKL